MAPDANVMWVNKLHPGQVEGRLLSARRNQQRRADRTGQDFAAPLGKGPFIDRVGEGKTGAPMSL